MTDQTDESPPSDELTFRDGTNADIPEMRAIMGSCKNGYFPTRLDWNRVRIAQIGLEAVGYVAWKQDEVLALYVCPARRGLQGIGSKLLALAEDAIRAAPYAQIRIMIDADAAKAQAFYQKRDYVPDWNRDNDDIMWMEKKA